MRVHGDQAARGARIDFAVNVRHPSPPAWLQEELAGRLADLGKYPYEEEETRAAVAALHGCSPEEVMLLSGVAEGFFLLPKLRPQHACVVHPSFTEPELALADAGLPVERLIGWQLAGISVPSECDLVVVGNPTNPTGVRHARADVEALRAGASAERQRIVVVDEAFMDMSDVPEAADGLRGAGSGGGRDNSRGLRVCGSANAPDSADSLAWDRPTGVVVARSLTKSFSLAGLRCGYFLGEPDVIATLSHGRAPWSVGTLALAAIRAAVSPRGQEWLAADRARMVEQRAAMAAELTDAGWQVYPSHAPFMLVKSPVADAIARAAARGIAVRRTDTFPGLDGEYLRLAVRPLDQVRELIAAVSASA